MAHKQTAGVMRDTVAENIRTRRAELGITQRALADTLGCTQAKVAQLESGARALPMDELPDVADALGTTPAAIVTPGSFFAKSGKKTRSALAGA